MNLKDFKNWVNGLPEQYDEFNIVYDNDSLGIPLLSFSADEDNKKIIFTKNLNDEYKKELDYTEKNEEEIKIEYIRRKIEEGEKSGIVENFDADEFLKEIKKCYKKKNKSI